MRDDVLVRINKRLNVLAALPTLKNGSIGEALKKSGFSRRDDGVYGATCVDGAYSG